MSRKTQSTLYFVAAALFLIATAINVTNDGLSIKSVLGLLMVAAMSYMGISLRKATS